MRTLSFALLLTIALGAMAAAPKITTYTSEEAAQVQCPYDVVVWLNPRTHLWYTRKSKHYANDRWGGFVCKSVVVKAGIKPGPG